MKTMGTADDRAIFDLLVWARIILEQQDVLLGALDARIEVHRRRLGRALEAMSELYEDWLWK